MIQKHSIDVICFVITAILIMTQTEPSRIDVAGEMQFDIENESRLHGSVAQSVGRRTSTRAIPVRNLVDNTFFLNMALDRRYL